MQQMPREPRAHQPLQPRHVGRDPASFNSDTSHMACNRHAEEKYEHTNRSCNQKTLVWVPYLCGGLGDGGGPCVLLPLAQIERLYLRAPHVLEWWAT